MIGEIKRFNSIGIGEATNLQPLFCGGGEWPLSGYLAGKERGGYFVRALEDTWCETFGVKHAIACNSATSGLLAACAAAGVESGTDVITTPFTMSATAAAPAFLGADIRFADIDDETFGLVGPFERNFATQAQIITNLFGHPARLQKAREMADRYGWCLIEDNAQSPFAMENGKYTGTIGHIGVWSLNVHKPIQCGEGGVCTTDDDDLAAKMRAFVNHGENLGGPIGLNLRMPEICAAIALTQLRRGKKIVAGRVEQAEAIIAAIGDIPGLRPPIVREGCTHVYYTIPFLVEKNRTEFCAALREQGVPIEEGYIDPLYRMNAFKQFARPCPVAEDLQDRRLFYFDNCVWDPTKEQIRQIGDAFKRTAEKWL